VAFVIFFGGEAMHKFGGATVPRSLVATCLDYGDRKLQFSDSKISNKKQRRLCDFVCELSYCMLTCMWCRKIIMNFTHTVGLHSVCRKNLHIKCIQIQLVYDCNRDKMKDFISCEYSCGDFAPLKLLT